MNWNTRLYETRKGIMLHYDDSTSDASGIEWLTKDPACHVSYNFAVQDNGTVVEIAGEANRAWHAGVCKPATPQLTYKDANSALYGIAITANAKDTVTATQLASVVALCVRLFRSHGWALSDGWRITSHAAEAWPRGRKVDCEGQDAKGQLRKTGMVMNPADVRRLVAQSQ